MTKLTIKKENTSSKNLLNEITGLLGPVKEVLKKGLSEKKIDKRLKKFAKLLIHDFKDAGHGKAAPGKKPVKKALNKKSKPATAKKKAAKKDPQPGIK